MRKIVLYIASTLDGYIAGPDGALDWLFTDGEYGYQSFFKTVDTLVMGRKTWEFIESYGSWPYEEAKGYVFTSLKDGPEEGPARFVGEPPAPFLNHLKQQQGKDIWLLGGGQLTRALLADDLIDTFILSIHPILLGEGIPLFPPGFPKHSLKLENTASFPCGLVQLTYSRDGR